MPVLMHNFRGKMYRLVWTDDLPEDQNGECDHPDTKHKAIRIRRDLSEYLELETLLHEAGHACNWDLDEEAITESAEHTAKLLWRLGWRKGTG